MPYVETCAGDTFWQIKSHGGVINVIDFLWKRYLALKLDTGHMTKLIMSTIFSFYHWLQTIRDQFHNI